MKIVSWNVNSVNVRLPNILQYLKDFQPDILCLQELKCLEEKYPLDKLNDAGYQSIQSCQKTYNGVSIISKCKPKDIEYNPVCIDKDEKRVSLNSSLFFSLDFTPTDSNLFVIVAVLSSAAKMPLPFDNI